MDTLSDDDSRLLLAQEWLVKIGDPLPGGNSSTANPAQPYLFKFHAASTQLRACFLITDTRRVWAEAMDAKRLVRRWCRLNPSHPPTTDDDYDDRARQALHERTIALVADIHTMKAVQTCIFSVEEPRDGDVAFQLRTHDHTWRWECVALGPRIAADILSTHLIMPLLSTTLLAFSSADPVSELSTTDLENAVDRLAKTGRRARDVHVRQTISRPRVTTTLRRLSAMFHFMEPAPPIIATLEEEKSDADVMDMPPVPTRLPSSHPPPRMSSSSPVRGSPPLSSKQKQTSDSATEPESDGDDKAASTLPTQSPPSATPSTTPPPKKQKRDASSTSEELKQAEPRRSAGVRQPIKRGGRRF